MSCYHPLKAFPIGLTASGKTKYKITSYECDHVERVNGNWNAVPNSNRSIKADLKVSDFIEIPCGKCIGCRLEYSKQWANRCMLEASLHQSNWFVTLTYDDDHLPRSDSGVPTLVKNDMAAFMKRLRKNTGQKIRFFGCGEYGSENLRPHLHILLFGLDLPEEDHYRSWSRNGFQYFNSSIIDKAWQYRGHAVVAAVTWDTCAYTARYVVKKANCDLSLWFDMAKIEPEFVNMSRDPGIARGYYENIKDSYNPAFPKAIYIDRPGIIKSNGKPAKPNKIQNIKYFERLFDQEDHESMKVEKEVRKALAESDKALKLSKTDKSYLEMLRDKEYYHKQRISSLQRNKIERSFPDA